MGRQATDTFDGLVVGYGRHTSDNNTPAVVASGGGKVVVKVGFDFNDVPDTASGVNGIATPQAHIIPRGSVIVRATLQVVTAWVSGSSGIMDIGLWSRGLATEVVDDADGLWDGGTVAELTSVGEINVLDAAMLPLADGTANAVGATSNSDVILTVEWETGVFTAGEALLVVEYYAPFGIAGRTLAV